MSDELPDVLELIIAALALGLASSAQLRSNDLPEVMTLEEAATFLRFNRKTVSHMAAAGELPGVKLGGRSWRFSRRLLTDWLHEQMISHRQYDFSGDDKE
jgi:excisionase family DNA binding protein